MRIGQGSAVELDCKAHFSGKMPRPSCSIFSVMLCGGAIGVWSAILHPKTESPYALIQCYRIGNHDFVWGIIKNVCRHIGHSFRVNNHPTMQSRWNRCVHSLLLDRATISSSQNGSRQMEQRQQLSSSDEPSLICNTLLSLDCSLWITISLSPLSTSPFSRSSTASVEFFSGCQICNGETVVSEWSSDDKKNGNMEK